MRWLLLRGLSREQRHWGELPRVLAERVPGAEPLCLDLAGAGTEHTRPAPRTVAELTEDLRARFIAAAGPGPHAILAVSLGGMIALDWCSRYPNDFARAVVINTSAGDAGRFWERFGWRNYPRIARGLITSEAVTRERIIIDMTINHPSCDRAALAELWATYARERPVRRSAVFSQLLAAARSKLPQRLDVPVLVLASKGDRLVSHTCSRRIAERLGAPIAVHETGGHDLPFDDAEWVADEVARWLAQTGADRRAG